MQVTICKTQYHRENYIMHHILNSSPTSPFYGQPRFDSCIRNTYSYRCASDKRFESGGSQVLDDDCGQLEIGGECAFIFHVSDHESAIA